MTSPAHIIVFGNAKSGSGTSTTAMHVAVGLLRLGYKVVSLDLDAAKGTLTRYMANRFEYSTATQRPLPSPAHLKIEKTSNNPLNEKENDDLLAIAISRLKPAVDFIVIDTAAEETSLSRLAHSHADTVVIMDEQNGTPFIRVNEEHHPALGHRSIFPEIFSKGLTLLDLKEDPDIEMTLDALAARQEIRQLLRALNPQDAKGYPHARLRPHLL